MAGGKPAGVRCIQLSDDGLCRLFGLPERPDVCLSLKPSTEMCRHSDEQAMACLADLERCTLPK